MIPSQTRRYSLIIYDYKGLAAAMSHDTREKYDETVTSLKSEGALKFSRYGLSEGEYIEALRALQDIQFRPLEEVSEQIKGLETKLGKDSDGED